MESLYLMSLRRNESLPRLGAAGLDFCELVPAFPFW